MSSCGEGLLVLLFYLLTPTSVPLWIIYALKLQSKTKVSADIVLSSQEDIDVVFRMTPYYFHTSIQDKEKLKYMGALETKIEFVIGEYSK